MSIKRGMDEDVHIYNGMLLSHKRNEIDSFVETHTEWSQKEKNKYHLLTHMWNLEKRIDGLICKAEVETQTLSMDTEGKAGWDELGNWDWHTYAIDPMYKIDN